MAAGLNSGASLHLANNRSPKRPFISVMPEFAEDE
jgi:hypothetical protein